jgi:hypothetical protein
MLGLVLIFTACPEKNNPPPIADCDPGYHPCETDSTECCLDTTSHNFVWEIDTLGDYGSYLNDVTIVNEDNVWVVGEIRTDSTYYGAARWMGDHWELLHLKGPGIPTTSIRPRGIWYFSEDNIWFASGSIYHWDGTETSMLWQRDLDTDETVEKIWASDQNNIYFVGKEGLIVHYDGSEFEKMESGHDVRLICVSGTPDGEYVFIGGYSFVLPVKTQAIMIHNGQVEELYYSEDLTASPENGYGAVSGVSVYGDTAYFVTYAGLWKYNFREDTSIVLEELQNYGYRHLNVQNANDIFCLGGGFNYVHYNGSTWDYNRYFLDNYDMSGNSAVLKNDILIMVGFFQDRTHAVVIKGER